MRLAPAVVLLGLALAPRAAAEPALDLACELWRGETLHARVTFRAERVEGGWRVRDRIEPVATGDEMTAEAILDGGFQLLSGRYERRNPQGFLIGNFTAGEDDRITLEHETPEYQNDLEPEGRGPAITTWSAWVAFLRTRLDATEPFEVVDFDPDPPAGDGYVVRARVEPHGIVGWRTAHGVVDARLFSLTRGKRGYRLAFGEDGGFLGLELVGLSVSVAPEGTGPVRLAAEDAVVTPLERAAARAAAVRDTLPLPADPLTFRGRLVLDGVDVGEATLAARPASEDGRPVWHVTEETVRRGGEAEVRSELFVTLSEDLSLVRGERRWRAPSGHVTTSFVRVGDRVRVVRTTAAGRTAPIEVAAHPRALMGLGAVALFLRHAAAGDDPVTYVLPGFDPRYAAAPKAGSGAVPTDLADLHVEVTRVGASRRAAVSARTGLGSVLVLDAATRALERVEGTLPRLDWLPPDAPAAPCDWFDAVEGTPTSARQAFITFGRGYHLPREDLLEKAFHWPSMLAAEVSAGSYPKDTPLARLRGDWVKEFVSRSKHRTLGDCDDLLMQIFMTMKVIEHPDGSVVFATLPVYGGHRYTLRALDGRWWITRVD